MLLYITNIISLLIVPSHTSTKIQSSDDIWPNLRRFINQFMKVGGIKTWKELTTGVSVRPKIVLCTTVTTQHNVWPNENRDVDMRVCAN